MFREITDPCAIQSTGRSRAPRVTRRLLLGISAAAVGAQLVGVLPTSQLRSASDLTDPPVLLHVSDAVSPGEVFTLNGEGLSPSTQVVVASLNGAPATTPPSGAVSVSLLQTDPSGHFVVCRLPSTISPGQVQLWAGDGQSWSAPLTMNRPRPHFLGENSAWVGQEITLAGRNFDTDEYGATGQLQARLVNASSQATAVALGSIRPSAAVLTIPQLAPGQYTVQVTTDGSNWTDGHPEETLTIVSSGLDPLSLGVGWAGSFAWANVVSVQPNPGVDVTQDVADAVTQAKAMGGGVVYFPAGTYELNEIALPADVVLRGAGRDNTTLTFAPTADPTGAHYTSFIHATGDGLTQGHHGVAELTINVKEADLRPDVFIGLGEAFGQNGNTTDQLVRTATKLFVKNVDITYDLSASTDTRSGRGLGLLALGKEHMLIDDNTFTGYYATGFRIYNNNWTMMRRNTFEFSAGLVSVAGSRVIMENNTITGHPDLSAGLDLHGLSVKDRTYVDGNTVTGIGTLDNNDGEALLVEATSNASFNYGPVTAATATSVTAAFKAPLVQPVLYCGYLAAVIIDGTGLGQLRKVTSVEAANSRVNLATPWTVTPDATSVVTLIIPFEQVTFHNNTIQGCTKGLWFYGNVLDGVMSDNTSIDSEGLYLHSARAATEQRPNYFVRMVRNSVTGVSRKSKHGGLGHSGGRGGQTDHLGIQIYAHEMRNNHLVGDRDVTPVGGTESPTNGVGLYAVQVVSTDPNQPKDTVNTLMVANSLDNMTRGVLLQGVDATCIADNTYTSTVSPFVSETGSSGLVVNPELLTW